MPRRRKTCECCNRWLQPEEDYWCAECREGINRGFGESQREIEQFMAKRFAGGKPASQEEAITAIDDFLATKAHLFARPMRRTFTANKVLRIHREVKKGQR